MNEYKNDNSTLEQKESEIFYMNTDLLISWREILWKASLNETTVFLINDLERLYEIKEKLTNFRLYTPDKVYNKFISEFNKTMYLIQKCLIKTLNDSKFPDEKREKFGLFISKLELNHEEDEEKGKTISELREEDPTTKMILKDLGLSDSKIEEIIKTGKKMDNECVLDVEKNGKLNK